jgi:hypothetical protein
LLTSFPSFSEAVLAAFQSGSLPNAAQLFFAV